GEILHPIRHAEDLVDDEHHGALILRLGIGDKGLDGAAVVLQGHPFAMPRRFFELRPGPILGGGAVSCEQEKGSSEKKCAFHRFFPRFTRRLARWPWESRW